jgi:hypothetical protein
MLTPLRAGRPAASVLRPARPSSQISNRYTAIRICSKSGIHNHFKISNRDTIGLFLLATDHSPLASEILIANPRLEFLLTPIRINQVEISNRKFSPRSRFESSHAPLASNLQNSYTGPSVEGESPWKAPSY